MPKILKPGFEQDVRAKLAVKPSELPDDVINQPSILGIAEAMIVRKLGGDISGYTEPEQLLLLESATIALICQRLCPTMPNRLKTDVTTLDVKWKRGKVDWEGLADSLMAEVEELVAELDMEGYTVTNFAVAKNEESDE